MGNQILENVSGNDLVRKSSLYREYQAEREDYDTAWTLNIVMATVCAALIAVAASGKETPCFRSFAAAFASSHSNSIAASPLGTVGPGPLTGYHAAERTGSRLNPSTPTA